MFCEYKTRNIIFYFYDLIKYTYWLLCYILLWLSHLVYEIIIYTYVIRLTVCHYIYSVILVPINIIHVLLLLLLLLLSKYRVKMIFF